MVLKIGVFGSTRGSDLPAVVESTRNGELKGLAEVAIVISDNANAGILDKARDYGIEDKYISPLDELGIKLSKEQYDRAVNNVLYYFDVGLVAMIGYMKLTSNWFVDEWRNKCMNIHPSLLPAFAGKMDLNVHEEVIKRGCKISGCTLIFIDEGADTGPIILQEPVPVLYGDTPDTPDTLKAKVQAVEQKILPEGIKLYAEGRLRVEGNEVYIKENRGK